MNHYAERNEIPIYREIVNNKQIARWLNQTPDILKRYRNNLRKKLKLNSKDDIALYLKAL